MLLKQPRVAKHIGELDLFDWESTCRRILALDKPLHTDTMNQPAVRQLITGLIQIDRASAEGTGAYNSSAYAVQFLSDGVDQLNAFVISQTDVPLVGADKICRIQMNHSFGNCLDSIPKPALLSRLIKVGIVERREPFGERLVIVPYAILIAG